MLEVMVATAILGVGLAAVVAAVGMAVRSASLAIGYEQARLVAETQLAGFLADRPERASERKGSRGHMNWHIRAEPDSGQQGLLQVKAEVRFFAPGGERVLILETRETTRSLPKSFESREGG